MARRGFRRGDTRLAAIWLVSLLAHVGVFAVIGLNRPGVRARPPVDSQAIDITLPLWRPPPPSTPRRERGEASGGAGREARSPRLHVSPLAPRAEATPSPLAAPPQSAGPGTRSGGGSGRAATQFPSSSGQLKKALRGTTGCYSRDVVGLNRREREACDDWMGRPGRFDAGLGAGIDPEKRDRFDRTAARQRANREWRENPTIPTGTSEEQGPGHPAGVGAATPVH